MENEFDTQLNNKDNEDVENIFHIDYEGQSLENSSKFKSWKNKMLEKYGRKSKFYKCPYDKVYFYGLKENNTFKDLELYNSYQLKCPLCQHSICCFCYKDAYQCCIRNRICFVFLYIGFYIINKENDDYSFYLILFFFPMCTLFLLIGIISKYFFHYLEKGNGNFYSNDDPIGWVKISINGLMALMLSFIFAIHDIYFKIFLLLISIFFKKYPIKYYLGIIKGGLR